MKRSSGVQRWIDDLPWRESLERLASQPTVNIEGLVAGYTGPGGKTVLPGARRRQAGSAARAEHDASPTACRSCARIWRARGFGDIEVNMSGGYDPTETRKTAASIRAQQAVFTRCEIHLSLCSAQRRLVAGLRLHRRAACASRPASSGSGMAAERTRPTSSSSSKADNPRVAGLREATMGYVDFLYEMATIR